MYKLLALFSVVAFIPLTPFAHKLPRSLNVAIGALLAILLVGLWTAFPFTQVAPFRVYFQQSIELSANTSSPGPVIPSAQPPSLAVVSADTTLTGLKGYVDRYISSEIPSSWTADVSCDPKGLRPDLMTCKWATGLLPSPSGNASLSPSSDSGSSKLAAAQRVRWLDVQAERLNATRALISVRGENTRGCRLYFDRPINYIHVRSSGRQVPHGKLQGGYEMPADGVKEARLWSRTWGKTFVVEVGWEQEVYSSNGHKQAEQAVIGTEEREVMERQNLSGRAACEWAEYASGALGGPESGTIPAFEEVKAFLPLWALPTKLADGLVEVWTRFVV